MVISDLHSLGWSTTPFLENPMMSGIMRMLYHDESSIRNPPKLAGHLRERKCTILKGHKAGWERIEEVLKEVRELIESRMRAY